MLNFLEKAVLPDDQKLAQKVAAIALSYTVISGILCFVDPKRGNHKRVLVPRQLREEIVMIHHSGPLSGHFLPKWCMALWLITGTGKVCLEMWRVFVKLVRNV